MAAAKDVAMHVAAMRPAALTTEELDPAIVAKEREVLRQAALQEGKPAAIVDKMVEGRSSSSTPNACCLKQPFVKDDKQTVGQYANSHGLKVNKFVHYVLGEISA